MLFFDERAWRALGIASPFTATRYHSLSVDPATVPDVLELTGSTESGVIMAIRHRELPIEGVQFHPERTAATFERLLGQRPAPDADHPIETIRASLKPSPDATALLARFVRLAADSR